MTLLLLAACLEPDPQSTPLAEDARPPGHERPEPETRGDELPALQLPEPPFTARSRIRPVTVVDKHGAPAVVLTAIGVELEVQQLLPDRALVSCTGCRAPVEGWVQRSAIWVPGAEASSHDEELLLHLSEQPELPEVARNGFAGEGLRRTAPPWYEEGGYSGDTLVAVRSKGGWTLELPQAEDKLEEAPEETAP